MNDYERIARVIRHLEQRHASQPALGELAAAAGLSRAHFHRLFRRWAGVTPKDFLQCLTLEHAKQCLRQSAGVLDAALDAGLSGPGRLHDLLVTIEAASPGEFKSGGRGIAVHWGYVESPFGLCSLAWNRRGICHLAFYDRAGGDIPESLRDQWPNAGFTRDDLAARRLGKRIFTSQASPGALKAFVRGSPFQLKVWRALLQIPDACVATYGRIARSIGCDKAVRAVGTACGANPIAWLIPCHRVIRETGIVKGYRWGETRKRAMLAFEAADAVVK